MSDLDDISRGDELTRKIQNKPALRKWYEDVYQRYAQAIDRSTDTGKILELGSGCGFVKDVLPEVVTSDVLPYTSVDTVVDATNMPFENDSLRTILMLNVFHHIPDVEAFLYEAVRCLKPGGRILIVDQHLGWISTPILKHVHHEPFEPTAENWAFDSTGPLSDANGALAWIVFQRDRERYEKRFPSLKVDRFQPHTAVLYWLAGGLKKWSLVPGPFYRPLATIDRGIVALLPQMGSFVDIELVKN